MTTLYTRTGDRGTTTLFGGETVSKQDSRVSAYGTIDECNAIVGWVRSAVEDYDIDQQLTAIQDTLFAIGSALATDSNSETASQLPEITEDAVTQLEQWIDRYTTLLPALHSFIYPTGTELASRLHITRTVCRRAERAAVEQQRATALSEQGIAYLNRLADFLFILARYMNWREGAPEVTWR